jgi:hypothetical protein
MEFDELYYLNQKKDHLSKWLRRYIKAGDVVPDVQANLDMTNWEIDALNNRPTVAGEVPFVNLSDVLKQDYMFTKNAFRLMPEYNPMAVGSATSIATSGTTAVYNYVAKYADTGDPVAIDFSNKYTKRYHEIQTQQRRTDQVRNLMQMLCSENTLQRFDRATRIYLGTKSETTARTDAANAIRNTLQGLEGDLFEKARTTPKENMTWQKMSQRLAKGTEECKQLIRQDKFYATLFTDLSEILKDRDRGSSTNLDNLWTQYLDFIYVVLGLLKPTSK